MSRTKHNRRKRFEYDDMYGTIPHKSKLIERASYRDFRQQSENVACPPIEEVTQVSGDHE